MIWFAAAIIVGNVVAAASVIGNIIAATIVVGLAAVVVFTAVVLIGLHAANAGAAAIDGCHFIEITAATAVADVVLRWEKFIYRELEGIKQFARIFAFTADTIVAGAVLIRQAEVVCRNQELDISFQLDDRELTKCDHENVAVGAEIKGFTLEAAADRRGNFVHFAAAATGRRTNLGFQQKGIEHLHNSLRHIVLGCELRVCHVLAIFGRVDMRTSFAAEKNAALIEDCEPINNGGTTHAGTDLYRNAVEETDIDCVKAAMELDFFDIDVYMKQFCCPSSNGDRTVVDEGLICSW